MASELTFPAARTWAAAVVCLALALLAGSLAVIEVQRVTSAIATARPVIALWSGVLGGLPLALMFLAAAGLLIVSLGKGQARRSAKPIMGFIVIAFIASFVTPAIGRAMVGEVLARHSYVLCPAIYERPVTHSRWALKPAICPAASHD